MVPLFNMPDADIPALLQYPPLAPEEPEEPVGQVGSVGPGPLLAKRLWPWPDADMTITNDHSHWLSTTISHQNYMGTIFSNQRIPPFTTSRSEKIRTWWSNSGSFDISYEGVTGTVKITDKDGKTQATFTSNLGGGLLAPNKPLVPGTDYTFYLFGGPDLLADLINGVIDANLPAFIKHINQNHPRICIGNEEDGDYYQINCIDEHTHIKCSYAALSPAGTRCWNLNIIFDVAGKVEGHLRWKDEDDFLLEVNGSILLQVTIDSTKNLSISVTKLACSICEYKISDSLIVVLSYLYEFIRIVRTFFGSPYRLAGALNTYANSQIIKELNKLITQKLPHLCCSANTPDLPLPTAERLERQLATLDNSCWMSCSSIQEKTLSQLKIPGTHDSATFELEPALSEKLYPEIAFLKSILAEDAPANGNSPFQDLKNAFYVGKPMGDKIFECVRAVSIAQGPRISEQLNHGVRYFDLRVYYDTRLNDFYIHHGLRGPKFTDLLSDFRLFLDRNSDMELIFMEISHTDFEENLQDRLADLVKDHLEQWLYMPHGAEGVQFDLQKLKDVKIREITESRSRVIVLNTEEGICYKHTLVNTPGFAKSKSGVSGVNTLADLADTESQSLAANNGELYRINWVLTPHESDIVEMVLKFMSGHYSPSNLLEDFAHAVNPALPDFLNANRGDHFHVVMVDHYHLHDTADFIVKMNFQN
jgi:hypothetical protein